MTYPYNFDKNHINKILKKFRQIRRPYLTLIPKSIFDYKKENSLGKEVISYKQEDTERLFSHCLYYWEHGKNIDIIVSKEETDLSMSFIKKILALKEYYLTLVICPQSKIYSKLKSNSDIEVFTTQILEKKTNNVVTEADSKKFLWSLLEPYFTFEKKRLDHKLFIEQLKDNLDKIMPYLFSLAANSSLSQKEDLLKYLASLQKHTYNEQSSYLQGVFMKWLTYNFLLQQ